MLDVADCVLGTNRDVTKAKKETRAEKNRTTQIQSHFWRLLLSVLLGLEKVINPPDTSRPAGSEARGEGRERGYFD